MWNQLVDLSDQIDPKEFNSVRNIHVLATNYVMSKFNNDLGNYVCWFISHTIDELAFPIPRQQKLIL